MSKSELPEQQENESTGFDEVDDDDICSMPTHRSRMPMHPPMDWHYHPHAHPHGAMDWHYHPHAHPQGAMDWHYHPHAHSHRRGKRVPRMLIAFLLGLLIGRMVS